MKFKVGDKVRIKETNQTSMDNFGFMDELADIIERG